MSETATKTCNCKNSKCIKLYCDCYANKQYCNKSCHCVECLNHDKNQLLSVYKINSQRKSQLFKNNDDLIKTHKGCACKKSGCMKKYCECFQAGIVCSDLCKCVQCQNTDESANRKIVRELKKSDSESNPNLLYKILLSENKQHYNTIVDNGDKHSKIDSIWLDKSAALLFSILNQQAQDHLPSNRGPSQKPSEAVEENAEQPSSLQCNQKLDPASLQIKVEVAQPTSHTKLTRLVDTFINLLKDLQNREKQKMDVQL